MFFSCPFCNSNKTICITSARRIALAASAINRLIIRHLSIDPSQTKNPVVLGALEELAGRLFEALDMALKIKYQEQLENLALTHVCIRCGRLFFPSKPAN